MKSATVGWSFYMFLINFSQQDELVWVQHFTWPSHDRFDLWGTALKSSLLSGETSSFDEIKHLSSLKTLSQSGCPFNIISSEWPMLIVAVYFYTYVSHTCHSLKSAAQHRDILTAMETISINYTSFNKGSPTGKDKTVFFSCRCTHRLTSSIPAVTPLSTSALLSTTQLCSWNMQPVHMHFCFQNSIYHFHFQKRLQLPFLQKVNLWHFS